MGPPNREQRDNGNVNLRMQHAPTKPELPGALVISLDFELQWGVRDILCLRPSQQKRLLAARKLVPLVLNVFEELSIHATWAIVGLLFAHSKQEAEAFRPARIPNYADPRLDPFHELTGDDETQDPFHFAPSLITSIGRTRNQEIASHSFSHYYCLEPGQGDIEFESDLKSAIAIAANSGYTLRSYVFPRNQVKSGYLPALRRCGVSAYRGNEAARAKAPSAYAKQRQPLRRAARWLDSYFDVYGHQTVEWPKVSQPTSVAASCYLRLRDRNSLLDSLLLRRIEQGIRHAAEHHRIFHLWCHPEDLAVDSDHNLQVLRRVLQIFEYYRDQHGMVSLTMAEVAELANTKRHRQLQPASES
jgi:peptidoglycan/xylan/chitin deacetylase (PgdA/CDA1 family)